jgi:hypothetical protein
MMKILHAWTFNGPNEPSPPPGDGWVSIRSVGGSTFWRLIEIESNPPQMGFVNAKAASEHGGPP